jgi:hypothetical protein
MKLIVGILLVFAVGGSYADLSDELMAAQADLALTHEFFETIMSINRGQLSGYIYRVGRFIIDSHMDTYEFIYTRGNAARARIEALQPNGEAEEACVARFFNRFELQKQRLGQGLARCIGTVHNVLSTWNGITNTAHHTGQGLASHIQNIGINLFAGTFVFDGDENFPQMINRELWNVITRVMNYVETVQEFINNISIDLENINLEFVQCDRDLEVRAERDIELEVGRAEACVGGGGGVPPAPTH